jgi:hypothetical protein
MGVEPVKPRRAEHVLERRFSGPYRIQKIAERTIGFPVHHAHHVAWASRRIGQ